MPFTRIILAEGRSETWLAQLSNQLHRTLVDAFDVPDGDRFQVIECLPESRLISDPHYLTGIRSPLQVQFHITAGRPRSRDQKANFYRLLTQRLEESPGIRPEDVMIVVRFNSPEDWCFGNGQLYSPERV
ncbi:tautomerase family protein [Sodalis ligni]|jgi:phenylpyruvate tautomerase PptA (4-oxalocrotonate tautomerase family)|uniref:Tautomerase-like protein n=1 Tax=Sodalis ligni TaxID=2697027 RepID=A0A4R1NDN3_9GAMM|nr:tautomerase family protein [Sodalis ligni]QWA11127.1 tautomerase family protein [Sodalis ligni]TCL05513.1 tautomerase-like protein [Sodalis ligni]